MKKTLKLLLAVGLLVNSGLFAIITAPSQLAPKQDIVYPPNLQNNVILTATAANGSTQTAQRTSSDPFIFSENTDLTISNNTIFTPLKIDSKKNLIPTTITLNGDTKNNVYYIETLKCENFPDDLRSFVKILNKAINNTDAIIYIESVISSATEQAQMVMIDKDKAMWIERNSLNGKFDSGLSPNKLLKINKQDSNIEPIAINFSKLGKQIIQEKLNINKITDDNIKFQTQIEALNTIERLSSVTSPENLNDEDKNIIKEAITEYLKASNNGLLDQIFLLQFNSTALEALKICITELSNEHVKKNPTQNISNDKLLEALDETIKTLDPIKDYRSLQEELASRLALDQQKSGDGTAVIDWYLNLNPNDQLLMEYDIKVVYGQEHIVNMDPNLLNEVERAEVKIYINDLLSRAINKAQIADLNAKLDAIDKAPTDTQKLQDLQNKLQTYSNPNQENAMIDWIATLSTAEQQSISEDVQAILVANTFNDLYNQTNFIVQMVDQKSIKELLILKTNLESLLNDNDSSKNIILDKAKVKITKNSNLINVSSDEAQQIIQDKVNDCTVEIKKMIINHIKENNNFDSFIDPESTNPYAKIFQQLSLVDQESIISKVTKSDKIAKANAELQEFQEATLPERIDNAGTTAELQALQTDAKAAGVTFGATTEKIFSNKFSIVEEAENRAKAANEPYLPAANNTTFLDPTLENAQGQTVTVDPTTGEKTPLPANGTSTNPDDAAAQAEIAQEDPELAKEQQDEEAKAAAAEQAREDTAKANDAINKANRENGGGGEEAI